jgi:large subunit ribosomal protein L20
MPRVKRGSKRREKRKKLLKLAKGFFLGKSKLYKFAKESVDRAGRFAYVGRRRKKRDFRRLWIIRINAAARLHEMSYSQLMAGLRRAGIALDRKSLAEIAARDPAAFAKLVESAKAAPSAARPATAESAPASA